MEVIEDEMVDILILARRLPCKDDAKNYERIEHVLKHGHLVIIKEAGQVVGYAECYRMKEIPSFPVRPLPVDDPEGKILYVWAFACWPGYLWKLKELGRNTFQTCTHFCWHRQKRKNALHLERIGD